MRLKNILQINKENINKLEQVSFDKKKSFFQNIMSSKKVGIDKKKNIILTIQNNTEDKEILKICAHILKKISSRNSIKSTHLTQENMVEQV